MSEQAQRSSTRLVAGVAVMALGVLFTLDNIGIVQAREVLRWWPLLLVFLGVARVTGYGRSRSRPVSGSILIVGGSLILLSNLGAMHVKASGIFPLILVFLGVAIIRGGYWGNRNFKFGYVGRNARRFGSWSGNVYGTEEELRSSGAWGPGTVPPAAPAPSNPAAAAGTAPGSAAPLPGEASGRAGEPGGQEPGTRAWAWQASGEPNQGPDASGMDASDAQAPGARPSSLRSPGSQQHGTGGGESPGWAGQAQSAGDPRDPSAVLKVDVFMASVSRKVASQAFRGGEVVAVMGGGDIDLRSARMAGEVARLEINLVMGGINLFVPDDWVVEYQGTPIMGGVEDTSRRPVGAPRGRLVITGALLWSAIVIKN